MRILRMLVGLTMCASAAAAHAADCRVGRLQGSTGTSGPPDENIQCQVMGIIFCSLSDYQKSGIEKKPAVDRTADWVSHLGQTGTHTTANLRPAVGVAADYIYSHDQMPPWTAYKYAVWTCGLNQRIPEPAAQRKIAEPWETAAQECLHRFPGEGDGIGNEQLRICLRDAMEATVAAQRGAK